MATCQGVRHFLPGFRFSPGQSDTSAPERQKAETARAGRYPAETEAGVARFPLVENTAVVTAMPMTAPNWTSVFKMPDAWPSAAGGTALSAAGEDVDKTIETPTPATTKGGTSSQ
jgi:hypothetical protein